MERGFCGEMTFTAGKTSRVVIKSNRFLTGMWTCLTQASVSPGEGPAVPQMWASPSRAQPACMVLMGEGHKCLAALSQVQAPAAPAPPPLLPGHAAHYTAPLIPHVQDSQACPKQGGNTDKYGEEQPSHCRNWLRWYLRIAPSEPHWCLPWLGNTVSS
jgi:hypothetical protein